MNRVFLAGNLTRDPEVRRLPSGSAVAKLGLAINRKYRTKAGEEKDETCFVDIEAWDRTAELCEKHLRKGAPILVEGSLRYREWNDSESGKKRKILEVRADRIDFLGRPEGVVKPPDEPPVPSEPAAGTRPPPPPDKDDPDDIPF
jgi:single-strand DNA-binding protein